jgi:hypothetical protein
MAGYMLAENPFYPKSDVTVPNVLNACKKCFKLRHRNKKTTGLPWRVSIK